MLHRIKLRSVVSIIFFKICDATLFDNLAMTDFVQMEGGVLKTGDNQLQEECGQCFHNKTGWWPCL
ncbi:hypothetical protein ACJMK2_002377 [Sinanodonta woodiana]|uniref:Secreted protein n=1 Tax=Sinanodonta woodiana TaxID=1069815 RepID=A0ABD3XWR3_SINWO